MAIELMQILSIYSHSNSSLANSSSGGMIQINFVRFRLLIVGLCLSGGNI